MAPRAGPSHLVVVGSSAGGIDALTKLLVPLPADFPAPLVLAQHLDPHQESHLVEILARHSALPIRTATTNTPMEPGVVYVAPPNHHVEIHGTRLVLSTAGTERSRPSVDRLLTTAAAAYGEQVIAVILSGTGFDGAAGARAVKLAGGTVLSQNPATARFRGMPQALAPTTVDLVADLERLGPLLRELVLGQRMPASVDEDAALLRFLEQLRPRVAQRDTRIK